MSYKPHTIRRNTKEAARVFDTARVCYVHSLRNGFRAEEISVKWARCAMFDQPARGTKLRKNDHGYYTVSVHSGLWYNIWTVCRTCELANKAARNYGGQAVKDELAAAPACSCADRRA